MSERIERRLLERFRANYLQIVEAFNRHDFEAAFAGTPPDFVFDISGVGLYERAAGMNSGEQWRGDAQPRGVDRVLSGLA